MKTFQYGKTVSHAATLTAVLAASLLPSLASANLASNTTVRNTVYVDYADGAGLAQPQISDEVDVVIQLVVATPSLNAPVDQTIAPSSTAIYNYTVTTNANGPDTYDITVGTPANTGGVTSSSVSLSIASATLGATTAAAAVAIPATTDTAIQVPSDADVSGSTDGIINGIAEGDTLAIGAAICTVITGGIDDQGTTTTGAIALSEITVNCDIAVNVTYGMLIREQVAFTLTVDPTGWDPDLSTTGTITVTTSAVDDDAVEPAADDETVTTVQQLLTVTKYVRNVTTPAVPVGPPPSLTIDGETYYASGVVGAPGETLEYLIAVTNTTSGNDATDTVISDVVPAFTTFDATGFAVLDDAGVDTAVTAAEDNDAGETVTALGVTTVYLYPGSATHGDDTDGGSGNPNGDGGTIAGGDSAYGRFRVVID